MASEKVRGVVLDTVKYSDRQNIVTIFAREQGRVSLLSSAGNGKGARLRNASLMPLSVISADINFNPTRELQFLGTFQRDRLWKDLYFNPVKSAIGMFMAEFLNAFLRQSPPDPLMWDFIVNSVALLDAAERGLPNFHLAFLNGFLDFAGIRPDLSLKRDDAWFDMREGAMTLLPPAHRDVLTPQEAMTLSLLERLNMRTISVFRFNAEQRRRLLSGLLHYYSLHFPGLSSLKSPAILAEVFS